MNEALASTGTNWEQLRQVYGWVERLAAILAEEDIRPEERQLQFLMFLMYMQEHMSQLDAFYQKAVAHLLKVTKSYAPHLFFCYQIPDLPRTNNGLEQSFGSVRRSERRATGRRGAVPGLVVHGAVRVQAALATRVKTFTAQDLIPYDLASWRAVRAEISSHQVKRCKQSRFRKNPSTYLAKVEHRLLSS